MKKLIYLLVVSLLISFSSCKKDTNIKPQTAPKETLPIKTQTVVKPSGITYDYQKAILTKRTITNH
ncbi:hypothetical protein [Mucilaginibacter lappiensis]|uniref:Uncharacterized protein n=1 Tax=Mucilaginibacter lappiensis TaxID=354630 RepID=A0A1N7BTR9_9SPHI|nr:hypothetical protein [Mucilaginibacter lappiensis]MBB6110037.1 hypothetical protein [Mucilaginibacter lappiensis]MBB6126745.1 hypothetical protein [Mucilaginibacter lappiensis]SIR54759.1 hypothetical protein SAMN05421821_108156 [Mucilaginibacter lappiensis]